MPSETRHLKLDENVLEHLLDTLDARDARSEEYARRPEPRFPYRMPSIRATVVTGRDTVDQYVVAARNIGRDGINFLSSHVLHDRTACHLHLITIQNSWQGVRGKVKWCRYIQGSGRVQEVEVRFDQPIDPALFAPSAIRARILIADDSPMARRLLAHMLEPLNVELVCVDNGVAAVKEALTKPFDLILMDLEMPQLDGLGAVKLLRKQGYIRPIAMVTCKTTPEERDACLLAGCDEFVPKPPQRERIAALVRKARPEPLVSTLLHETAMHELIDDFALDLLRRAPELETAYHNRDLNQLMHLARELKGEAGGFGFQVISKAATLVETAVMQQMKLTELRPILSQLVRYCLAARPATCDAFDRLESERIDDYLPAADDYQPPLDEFMLPPGQ